MTDEPARELYQGTFESIQRYVDILAGRGTDWGVIGPREADRLWDRHIFNSAAMADLMPIGARVVDVGSGAGLPGIPLAILRSDLSMVLLEPLLRRANFLADTIAELGLDSRVQVVRSRAEDHQQRYDVVASRALAPMSRLIQWCAPLLAPSGVILALKGSAAPDEVASVAGELARRGMRAEVLSMRANPLSSSAVVVRVAALTG